MATDLDQIVTRIQRLALARALPALNLIAGADQPTLCFGETPLASLTGAATVMLPCPTEQKALLMEISPDIYFETDDYIGKPAVLIQLDVISDEELSLRLEDAWRFQAPPGTAPPQH